MLLQLPSAICYIGIAPFFLFLRTNSSEIKKLFVAKLLHLIEVEQDKVGILVWLWEVLHTRRFSSSTPVLYNLDGWILLNY